MELARKEEFSIFLYVKNCLLANHFAEQNLKEPLIFDAESNTYSISYDSEWIDIFQRGEYAGQGEGRGLVYFDIPPGLNPIGCSFQEEQTNMVVVYDSSLNVISGCNINYLKGEISYNGAETPSVVDYYWHFVSTIDAWPYIDIPQLPIVSVINVTSDRSGIQLGGGHKRLSDWNVQIFAANKGQRTDLKEILFDGLYLKSCPLLNFGNGMPLNRNGTFNNTYIESSVDYYSDIKFMNVKSQVSGLPDWGFYKTDTLNKFRAEITFSTETYYM